MVLKKNHNVISSGHLKKNDENLEDSESENVSISDPNETQDESQYGINQNDFEVGETLNTDSDLTKKNRNVFVGFINDMNVPQIIDRKHLKNQENNFKSKETLKTKPNNETVNDSNVKKLQLKFTDDVNRNRNKKRNVGNFTKSGKIVKVNIIDDAQINLIKNVKKK